MLTDMNRNDVWTKAKMACLYRYKPTGQYFARVRFGGKLHRKKLNATDYQLARRKLANFKRDLEPTDARLSNTSLNEILNKSQRAIGALSPKTQRDRRSIIEKLRRDSYGADFLPL